MMLQRNPNLIILKMEAFDERDPDMSPQEKERLVSLTNAYIRSAIQTILLDKILLNALSG